MALFCSSREFDMLCHAVAGKADLVRLQVKGGSMFPFIRSGDWVEVALYKDAHKDIRKGDILLFKKVDKLYLHRMLRRSKDGFIIKGDMSFGHDGAIPADDIVATVISIERNGRRIDMGSKTNRLVAVTVANASELLQYPVLAARKTFSIGLAAFSRIQSLHAYRRFAKSIIKADVSVREARPDDAEAIRDIFIMGGHDPKQDIIDIKKEGFWLVAELERKVVGGLTVTRYEKDPGLWIIFGLEVKHLLRGLGIGERMVRHAVAKAREGGAKEIGLFVNKKNNPALALYHKAGFKVSDDFPAEFNRSPNELYLSYAIDV